MCVCVYIYEGRLKNCWFHPEKRDIAEHFCCGNALLFFFFIKLEKLNQISVLISVRVEQKICERYVTNLNSGGGRNF